MNKYFALGAFVAVVLVLVMVWVFRSAQATQALKVEPYTSFTELRMLAATPTVTPDRHDLNVEQYLNAQAAPETLDREPYTSFHELRMLADSQNIEPYTSFHELRVLADN